MVVEEFWLIPLRGNSGESRYEGILANPTTREFWRIRLRDFVDFNLVCSVHVLFRDSSLLLFNRLID